MACSLASCMHKLMLYQFSSLQEPFSLLVIFSFKRLRLVNLAINRQSKEGNKYIIQTNFAEANLKSQYHSQR